MSLIFVRTSPHGHPVYGIEDRGLSVKQLSLVLGEITDLDIMASPQISSKRNLAHYALDKSGFALTVLSDKSHLLSALDGEFGMVENLMPSVGLPYVFKNQRIVAATGSRGKLQPQSRVVHLVHLNRNHLVQLFYAALHLSGF